MYEIMDVHQGSVEIEQIDCKEAIKKFNNKFQLIYIDPPFNTGKTQSGKAGKYEDRWETVEDYLNWLIPLIQKMWNGPLNSTGSLVVHCDPTISHYIKVCMDNYIGSQFFCNEIIWKYNSGGASKSHLSKKHDTLLWYGKLGYTFNVIREPYATPGVENRPGFHKDGRMLTDVWDISFISTTSSERTGYPTQKPLALLQRVINLFTNPSDQIADFFAGSGTTGDAAKMLNRNCYLSDKNPEAIKVMKERLG